MKKIVYLLCLVLLLSSCFNEKKEVLHEVPIEIAQIVNEIKDKNNDIVETIDVIDEIIKLENNVKVTTGIVNNYSNQQLIFRDCSHEKPFIDKSENYYSSFCTTKQGVFYSGGKGILKKLFDADPKNFNNYGGNILDGKYYYDDNNVFYFPINGNWEKIGMNISKLSKIKETSYFYDDKNYFFEFGRHGLIKLGLNRKADDIINYLWSGLIIINNNLYYNGKFQFTYNNIDLIMSEDKRYFILDNRIFFLSYFDLIEIENANISTFSKISNYLYEDINNIYELVDGHYGFTIETKVK